MKDKKKNKPVLLYKTLESMQNMSCSASNNNSSSDNSCNKNNNTTTNIPTNENDNEINANDLNNDFNMNNLKVLNAFKEFAKFKDLKSKSNIIDDDEEVINYAISSAELLQRAFSDPYNIELHSRSGGGNGEGGDRNDTGN